MNDKEYFVKLSLIHDALEKNDVPLANSIVSEQLKKVGLKIVDSKINGS